MNNKNILSILIPVLIGIIVFILPAYIQEPLVLKMDKLTYWNWFSYIFVHQNFPHLFVNIVMFLASMFMAYFILPKKDKEAFYIPTLLIIILVPLLSFIATFYLRNIGLFPSNLINHRGFSGISSAASGFLGFAIAKRVLFLWGQEKHKNLLLHLSYFIFIPSLALMVWHLSLKFAILIFIFWILLNINLIFLLKREKIIIDKRKWTKKEVVLVGLGLIILFFGVSLLIPENIVQNGSAVNILAHLFGFVIGFVTMFIFYASRK
jgi:membrane associated rhomboid family serine protease